MGTLDIIIAVVVPVLVLAAVGIIIYRKVKKKGGAGCDCCDCSKCSGCPHCAAEEKENR
ncbi:MAG: hypothetical protein J1F39_03900 [Clostridiales bacterium]|nr:hypothetical protein [Clostridiales bacterium]